MGVIGLGGGPSEDASSVSAGNILRALVGMGLTVSGVVLSNRALAILFLGGPIFEAVLASRDKGSLFFLFPSSSLMFEVCCVAWEEGLDFSVSSAAALETAGLDGVLFDWSTSCSSSSWVSSVVSRLWVPCGLGISSFGGLGQLCGGLLLANTVCRPWTRRTGGGAYIPSSIDAVRVT